MRLRLNDLPMRLKFILLYLLGVLLPLVIVMVYVLSGVTGEIRRREQQSAIQSLDRVHAQLMAQFSGAITLSNAISTDNQLLSMLEAEYPAPAAYYSTFYNYLRPMFLRYQSAYAQHVNIISVYSQNRSILSGGCCMRIDSKTPLEKWYPPQNTTSAQLVCYKQYKYSTTTESLQVSVSRNFSSGTLNHVLKIDLNMEIIHRAIARESDYLSIYLVSPEGYAVSYPGSTNDANIADMSVRPPADATLTQDISSVMPGWKLCAVMNTEPMETAVNSAVRMGVLIGVICSVFAGLLSLLLANSILKRSRRLLRHMDSLTAEDFAPIQKDIGHDEIGELIEHFNAMGMRLKQLIQDIYVLELKQKSMDLERVRGELKYLQAQVDPHFLFNTLNAILVLCVRNGYGELTEIIRALSKILRRMLDTSRDVLTLKEELEFVRMVLTIEQFRFGDKLKYDIDVSEAALGCEVPVMSVQGLTENACKHGVQHISGQGRIEIRARIEGGYLVISVTDNGAGMTRERLAFVKESLASHIDTDGSVGLQNIYRRLKLHYGDKASLVVEGEPGAGTKATIRIPTEETIGKCSE